MSKFINTQIRLASTVLLVFVLTLLYNKIVTKRRETFQEQNVMMNAVQASIKAIAARTKQTIANRIPELTKEQAEKSVVLQKKNGMFVTTHDLKVAYESNPVQAGMTAWNLNSCLGVVSSAAVGPLGPLLLVTNLSSCQDGLKSLLEAIGIHVTGHKPFLSIGDTILPELKNAWDAFTGNRGEKRGCSERTNPFYCTFKCGLWSNSGHKCSCC